ncbi:MAG: hypothetical protein GX589_09190 [Deltaproteobacteria bacterium]|nr:hypothetical protein [Deltaproteobacteria bacterium]
MQETARKLWPQALDLDLRAMSDLRNGDFTSDFCLRTAALMKLPPAEIGARLIAEFPPDLPVDVDLVEGYLNFRLTRVLVERWRDALAVKPVQENARETLILVVPATEARRVSYLRQLSLGLIQFSILRTNGVTCRLLLGDNLEFNNNSDLAITNIFTQALSAVKAEAWSDSVAIRSWVEQIVRENEASKIFVRLPWRALSRRDFSRLWSYGKSRLQLCGDEKIWQQTQCEESWVRNILDWNPMQQAALIVYLAGPQAADDLDPAVPRLGERSNLLWQIWCTMQRAVSMVSRGGKVAPVSSGFNGACFDLNGWPADQRELCVRALFLSEFYNQACIGGKVREFVLALECATAVFNQFMNCPARRQSIENSTFSEGETEIMTGVCKVLSGIMDRLELYQVWLAGIDGAGSRPFFIADSDKGVG